MADMKMILRSTRYALTVCDSIGKYAKRHGAWTTIGTRSSLPAVIQGVYKRGKDRGVVRGTRGFGQCSEFMSQTTKQLRTLRMLRSAGGEMSYAHEILEDGRIYRIDGTKSRFISAVRYKV